MSSIAVLYAVAVLAAVVSLPVVLLRHAKGDPNFAASLVPKGFASPWVIVGTAPAMVIAGLWYPPALVAVAAVFFGIVAKLGWINVNPGTDEKPHDDSHGPQ